MTTLPDSELRALSIATDELLSYVETVEDEDEDSAKIRWAIRKLDAILVRNGRPEWVSLP